MPPAGMMDRRITIEQPARSVDDYGQSLASWSTFATVWAALMYDTPSEKIEAAQVLSQQPLRFRLRWLSGVNSRMRVKYDGEVYDITGVTELGRRDGLELICVRRGENEDGA